MLFQLLIRVINPDVDLEVLSPTLKYLEDLFILLQMNPLLEYCRRFWWIHLMPKRNYEKQIIMPKNLKVNSDIKTYF